MPPQSYTRFYWLDLLRVMAVFAIVVMHVSVTVLYCTPDTTSLDWCVANLASSAVRWCVPVFVLISGALLLDPAKQEPAIVFYKKRLARIFIPLVFWTCVYLSLRAFESSAGLTLNEAITSIVQGTPYGHLWYLYMIPALYLFTPFLRTYIRSSSPNERLRLIILLLCLTSLAYLVKCFYLPATDTSNALTRFIPYLGYYLCGYEIRSRRPPALAAGYLPLIILAAIAVIAVGTYFLVGHLGLEGKRFLYGYVSAPVVITSIAIFTLIYKLAGQADQTPTRMQTVIRHLAPTTFGIYLIHPIILAAVERTGLHVLHLTSIPGIPLLAIVGFAGSYAIIAVMIRIPYLRRTVA